MKPVMSAEYRTLNRTLHAVRADYGAGGGREAANVVKLARQNGYRVILDYGCGKGTLKQAVAELAPELTILEFDPAIEGKDTLPTQPTDCVVAFDVMEHIEPEYLDHVLDAIRLLQPRSVMFVIATRPAKKTLPDGRNAHLIVQPISWWLERLAPRFHAAHRIDAPGHFTFIGAPLPE